MAEEERKLSCHFWDPQSGAGKLSHSKCEKDPVTFVRVKHSGRLCPLCKVCLRTFESAQHSMSADVKKSVPGNGEYEVVPLADWAEEYARQPPKP